MLGVALRQARVWKAAKLALIDVRDDRLTDGFRGYEPDGDLRWTNGDALLPANLFGGLAAPFELELHLAGRTNYPLLSDTSSRRAA